MEGDSRGKWHSLRVVGLGGGGRGVWVAGLGATVWELDGGLGDPGVTETLGVRQF